MPASVLARADGDTAILDYEVIERLWPERSGNICRCGLYTTDGKNAAAQNK
jgi:hypothetical protein